MKTDLVVLKDGKAITTSLRVAEVFGKKHKNVLQNIQVLDIPEDFAGLNFQLSEYKDSTGRSLPMYEITRDGFTLLAMGFTGTQAMQFKLEYIAAFNAMEKTLQNLTPGTLVDALIEQFSSEELAIELVTARVELADVRQPYDDFKHNEALPPWTTLQEAAPAFDIEHGRGKTKAQFLKFQFQRVGMLDDDSIPINGFEPFFVRVRVPKSGKMFTALVTETIDQLWPIFYEKIADLGGLDPEPQ